MDGIKFEMDAILDAPFATDIDAAIVTVNEFDDAGELETVLKEERDTKADDEALTLFVIPVFVAKIETLTLLVIPLLVAKTETDADKEGFDTAVAMLVTVEEIEGGELTDTESVDLAEFDVLIDIDVSNDVKPDSVGSVDCEALKDIILELVCNAENDAEPVLEPDFDAILFDPLLDLLEIAEKEAAGEIEPSTIVTVLVTVDVRVDKLETLTAEEIVVNAFVGLTLDVDTEDPLLD